MTTPDEDGDEDARDLRPDREHRGDDERRAVRAQEAEQAHERAPALAGPASRVLVGHGFVGYGSCSRPCPTSRKGGARRPSPRSELRSREGALLLDVHSDPDHNRSVYTLAAAREELVDALVAGIAAAVELVDLREHVGVHPRVGRCRRRPARPARTGGDRGRCGRGTSSRGAHRIRARSSGLPLRRAGHRAEAGVLQARRARRAPPTRRVGRARARAMARSDRSALGRRPRRSPPGARRLQRRARDRRRRGRARGRARQSASRAAACPECRRSAFGSRARDASR